MFVWFIVLFNFLVSFEICFVFEYLINFGKSFWRFKEGFFL